MDPQDTQQAGAGADPQAQGGRDPGTELMLAFQAGDESAFERLVEQHSGQVFALLTRFLGRHSAREDMVQEVFLRVVRARERYQPTARFTTWLYRIVFNLSVNETQRASGRGGMSLDAGTNDGEDAPREWADASVPDPSEGIEREDVVQAVRAAIQALPETQRMALVLARYEGLPYVEIAEVLDSSEKAIKSLVHRARETLRVRLGPLLREEYA